MQGPVALVVDDDPDIAMICSLQLGKAGFTVVEAGTGEQALRLARARQPAVILLDFLLPDIDGVEVMHRLQRDRRTRDIPVVMLTARTNERDQRAAWKAGVHDFVSKPFDGQALVEAARSAATLRQAGDHARARRTTSRQEERRQAPPSHREDAWLAGVIQGAHDAIICKTLDGEITYWNAGAERLYGWHASEALGRHISMLAAAETQEEIPSILEQVARGETVQIFDTVRMHRDGHRVNVSLCVSPIVDEDGAVVGASAIARDITGHKQTEAQLSGLLEAAPDAIVAMDGEGRVTLVNRQAERIFGYRREELVGHRVDTFIQGAALGSVPRPRSPEAPVEVVARRSDRSTFPVEVSMSAYQTDDGVMTVAAVRDITQRKRADERFRAVVEAAPDAMLIVSEDGRIQLVNARMVALFGYERHELVGQPVEMLVPDSLRERHVGHRRRFAGRASVRPMGADLELCGRRKDGTELPVEISLSPLVEDGGGTLTCATIRDVTDRRLVENAKALAAEREREAAARLREIDRLRSDFLSTVSHELRTPLTTIRGFSEWLTTAWDTTDDERKREMLGRIHHAASRLDLLVQDLLDISRLERGRLRVDIATLPLADVVEDAVANTSSALERHEVRCDVASVQVLADRSTLMRVLENLLTNAAKFSEPGSTIEVSAHDDGTHAVLSVRDHGIGIPESERERIFDRFYRIGSTAQATPGTGIGLAIVKQFTQAQGGSVSVHAPEGGGAEFRVRLSRAAG